MIEESQAQLQRMVKQVEREAVCAYLAIESVSKMPITNVAGAAEYLLSGLKYYSLGGEKPVQSITTQHLHDASDKDVITFVATAIDNYIGEYLA